MRAEQSGTMVILHQQFANLLTRRLMISRAGDVHLGLFVKALLLPTAAEWSRNAGLCPASTPAAAA